MSECLCLEWPLKGCLRFHTVGVGGVHLAARMSVHLADLHPDRQLPFSRPAHAPAGLLVVWEGPGLKRLPCGPAILQQTPSDSVSCVCPRLCVCTSQSAHQCHSQAPVRYQPVCQSACVWMTEGLLFVLVSLLLRAHRLGIPLLAAPMPGHVNTLTNV